MGTFSILFPMLYPWSPQKFSSVGIVVISNVYFDRTIVFVACLHKPAETHVQRVAQLTLTAEIYIIRIFSTDGATKQLETLN